MCSSDLVHIEDQLLPKKCGHLNDKKLADARDKLWTPDKEKPATEAKLWTPGSKEQV